MNDKSEITEIITRYFAFIDEREFGDNFEDVFTQDAVNERPNGAQTIGSHEIATSAKDSFARFRATQHLTSGFLVELINETSATYRVNVVAMHLWADGFGDATVDPKDNYFLAGGVVSGKMFKVKDVWAIQTIRNDVVWRQGVGFQQMLNTK